MYMDNDRIRDLLLQNVISHTRHCSIIERFIWINFHRR